MTAYVGRTDGEPCTTGFGAVAEGHVGVFNIATPPAHRNRGFGTAVTARVVADGVRAGAHTAYLQASPMGFGVYERMGFRTVETWSLLLPGLTPGSVPRRRHQPRSRHSSRCGRSAPSVESSPWPG